MPPLPDDLIAKILSFLDVQQRIGTCSLVCRAWRTAAAAATPDISVTLQLQDTSYQLEERCRSLTAWRRKHGRQAHRLHDICTDCDGWLGHDFAFDTPATPFFHLPCCQLGQLQQLSISGVALFPDATAAAAAAAAAADHITASSGATHSSIGGSSQQQSQPGPGFLPGLSSLTKLQLTNCSIAWWQQELAGLSALQQLQHLQLEGLKLADVLDEHNVQQISAGLAVAVPHLSQLTYISVKEEGLEPSLLQGFSQLQQLRELRLQDFPQGAALTEVMHRAITQLPNSICVLAVTADDWTCRYSGLPSTLHSSSTARLRKLSRLQQLELPGFILQDSPGLLGGLSQLTSLDLGREWYREAAPTFCPPWSSLQHLQELRLGVETPRMLQDLPLSLTLLKLNWLGTERLHSSTAPGVAQLTALQHFEVDVYDSQICPSILRHMQQLRHLDLQDIVGEELPVLLSALQSMQQLQRLSLYSIKGQVPEDNAVHQYAALTASSQLTHLDLSWDDQVMAGGAAQYMFAEGKQLPLLQNLCFGMDHWEGHSPQLFEQGDLARLAAACPALQQLWVLPRMEPHTEEIASLVLLTSVTQLHVACGDLPLRELTAVLFQMSQLVDLQVSGLDAFGLAALTQLTGLRHLFVESRLHQPLLEAPGNVSLHSRASPPDVWSQLQEPCLQDRLGAAAIAQLKAEQAATRERIKRSSKEEATPCKQAALHTCMWDACITVAG
uniref:F-box domain-containing protein n=1 Tax=Tetradesmus obliquus TaxID=3088 RepID=A0A383V902_TETOB|eukprot:jgi/Sobl393_1/18649/SZX61433.1